jgi:hypothetical protein
VFLSVQVGVWTCMVSFACIDLAALPKLARITSLRMYGAKVCYQDYVMLVLRWRASVSAVRNKGNVSDSVAENFICWRQCRFFSWALLFPEPAGQLSWDSLHHMSSTHFQLWRTKPACKQQKSWCCWNCLSVPAWRWFVCLWVSNKAASQDTWPRMTGCWLTNEL